MTDRRTALILGASRGLGLALVAEWCRLGWQVVATVRGDAPALGEVAARWPGQVTIATADVDDAASVRTLRDRLAGQVIDILFVNAGICRAHLDTPATADERDFLAMMRTNALGPMRAVEILEDLVPRHGVIAVMSSELGSIAQNPGFWELYSASKAALNMLMKCFAARHGHDSRAMLLIAPGWVRTDMGGAEATLSIEESIPQVVQTVMRRAGVPGLACLDRFGRSLPW